MVERRIGVGLLEAGQLGRIFLAGHGLAVHHRQAFDGFVIEAPLAQAVAHGDTKPVGIVQQHPVPFGMVGNGVQGHGEPRRTSSSWWPAGRLGARPGPNRVQLQARDGILDQVGAEVVGNHGKVERPGGLAASPAYP